jgi:hypothetical protein
MSNFCCPPAEPGDYLVYLSWQELESRAKTNPPKKILSEEAEILTDDAPTVFFSLVRDKCFQTDSNPACLAFFDILKR